MKANLEESEIGLTYAVSSNYLKRMNSCMIKKKKMVGVDSSQ